MQTNSQIRRVSSPAVVFTAAVFLSSCAAVAQTASPITNPPAADKPAAVSPVLTKSSYPIAKAEPKQFTVEYVYRYEEMEYTPEVAFTAVDRKHSAADTPEQLFVALVSSMKTLDYDWWLSLWDAKAQAEMKEAEKTKGQGAPYWRDLWKGALEGQSVTLVKRLRMPNDTILQFRLGPHNSAGDALIPAVMRYEAGHWQLTSELNDNQFLFNFLYGVPKVSMQANWVQTEKYSGQKLWQQDAQAQFFKMEPKGADSATQIVW
jgi:hypothetical protein